jgi:hypothetical protein
MTDVAGAEYQAATKEFPTFSKATIAKGGYTSKDVFKRDESGLF